MPLESDYQRKLIKKLERMFPGCFILKNDEQWRPGIPDLTILFGPHWAILEVKRSDRETYEPNQEYYLEKFDEMRFAAMICPQNEGEVLNALQRSFGIQGTTRRTQRQQRAVAELRR